MHNESVWPYNSMYQTIKLKSSITKLVWLKPFRLGPRIMHEKLSFFSLFIILFPLNFPPSSPLLCPSLSFTPYKKTQKWSKQRAAEAEDDQLVLMVSMFLNLALVYFCYYGRSIIVFYLLFIFNHFHIFFAKFINKNDMEPKSLGSTFGLEYGL